MSRIRSIHPGLFTDECFAVLSPMARLLFIGIWTECDDWGSFEWSPLKLKMRLLPADNADAAQLLAEIEAERGILRYEVNGKTYGAVRNFCQYQRPKKPNQIHPQTEEVRKWVNTEARSIRDGSEPVGNQLPTKGEKPRQMKDEGCNKKDEPNGSFGKTDVLPDPQTEKAEVLKGEHVVEAWNAMAGRADLPQVRKLTPARRRHLAARIRENTIDEFTEAIAAVERSPFCRGANKDGWKADFDFMLQPKSFTKLLEGAYGA